jgi:putative FmdB family regulatory protein
MPTYEYICSSCSNAWEEIQKISEPALEVCPKCNQHTAKRQISGGNFILKGGGWYADLYSSTKPAAKKDEGGSGSSSSSNAKSDTSAAPAKEASAAPAASTSTSGGSGGSGSSGAGTSAGSGTKE